MDDDTLNALLARAVPPSIDCDAAMLDELDELIRATEPAQTRRRRLPRATVTALVVAGTLGVAGAAAAGGYLPASMSPWADHELQTGTTCRMAFMAHEQVEPAKLAGKHVSQTDERRTIIAAQAFLDRLDVDSIDVDAAVRAYLTARDRVRAQVPPHEWAPATEEEVEIFALINEAAAQLSVALDQQGLDPDAVSISTTYDCGEPR